ncbi:MAG: M48 family peptidase [Gammaproteobacteria bacterium]|nr:MAG: M48 family peptidase [Gammaproteobacteria bacterium]
MTPTDSIRQIRKAVKRLTLRVRADGEVIVTIPRAMPQDVVDAFVLGHREWISRKQAEFRQRVPADVERPVTQAERRALQSKVEALVAEHAPRMGVTVREIRLRAMRTRWGSCNIREQRIWISTRLVHYPESCLEAVVVHELAHLIERGHTPRFYALMDQYYPAWREAEQTLNGRLPRRVAPEPDPGGISHL